jgi:hypothetical protein
MNMKVIFGHNKDEVSEQCRYYTKGYVEVCTDDLFH